MSKMSELNPSECVVKVIAVGDGGGNLLRYLVDRIYKFEGVEYLAVNTNLTPLVSLKNDLAVSILQIGESLIHGLGTDGDFEIGKQAAEEVRAEITNILTGADAVIFLACLGGGTATGATPVFSKLANQVCSFVANVVITPFGFEANECREAAEGCIRELNQETSSVIVVSNENLVNSVSSEVSLFQFLEIANHRIYQIVRSVLFFIFNPVTHPCIDFSDSVLVNKKLTIAKVGIGLAKGKNRADAAVLAAMNDPLLEVETQNAFINGVFVSLVTNRKGLCGLDEFNTVGKAVSTYVRDDAIILIGLVVDNQLEDDDMEVVVIAS